MMFGLGVLGSGGSSSSSSSNLSPLAPPFTVDRFNHSKPNSNQPLPLNDSSYNLLFSQSWQYANPSASSPGFLPKPELGADSMRTTSVPLAEENSVPQSVKPSSPYWSTQTLEANPLIDAFSYVSEGRPYYPPYTSPVVGENTPLLAINEPHPDLLPTSSVVPGNVSSQVDYTQSLAGLQYSAPHSTGVWNGLTDQMQGKKMEVSGNLSLENATAGCSNLLKNSMNQGVHSLHCGNKNQDNSGTFCGNFTERETHDGFLKMGHVTDKSYLVQELGFYPSMFSTSSELHSVGQSMESSKDFRNYKKPYNPYEKCIQPPDSYKCDNVPAPKSSTTVVIRPPTAGNISSIKKGSSHKTGDGGKFAAIQIDGLGSHDPLKGGLFQPANSTEKGVYLNCNQLNLHKDDDRSICNVSWSLKENLSCQSPANDAFKQTIESSSGSQVTFNKVLDDISLASNSIQAVRYTESYSDGLDHHNPNVDSPCWKGAPASRTSPFEDEAAPPPQGNHQFPLDVSTNATSHLLCESNVHNENESAVNVMAIPSKSPAIENYTTKEHLPSDAGKAELDLQTLSSSKGVQISLDLSNSGKLSFGDSVDAVLNINDASEGCTVALHAAEKVLHSPSSQEDSEHNQTYGRLSNPKMDVQTLVMAIHNLSELLQFHCSTDACRLREQDHQALKYAISNLSACIPKSGMMNATHDKVLPVQNMADKIEEGFHMDTGFGIPQLKNEAARCLHDQPGNQNIHEAKNHCGEKTENFKLFPSSSNLNISEEDNVAQAIVKVLNENFQFDGEMKSQAHLFKNLWLEAEAKLCSVSYKARFDHMKIAMELQNSTRANENVAAAEKSSRFKHVPVVPDGSFVRKTSVQSSSVSCTTPDIHDIEGSIMARYNILKCRDGNSNSTFVEGEQDSDVVPTGFTSIKSGRPHIGDMDMQNSMGAKGVSENSATANSISSLQSSPEANMYSPLASTVPDAGIENCSISCYTTTRCNDDAESSVMARLNILKGRDGNFHSTYVGEEQYPDSADAMHSSHTKSGQSMYVKLPEEKILNATIVPLLHQRPGVSEVGSYAADGSGKESMKEFQLSVANNPVQQTNRNNRVSMGSSTLYDTSSSDWEHVQNDDFAWQS
nr:uncharacterized protein LOC109149083 isoform X3 [Ipomoea batatas]